MSAVAQKFPARSDVLIALVATLAFWALSHHEPARLIDAIAVRYFIEPGPLKTDHVFFAPAYWTAANPYFFQHRAIAALVQATGWSIHTVAEIFQFVAFLIAAFGVLHLTAAVTRASAAKAAVLLLFAFNLNVINTGAFRFFLWGYAPQNLSTGIALFALSFFIRGRYAAAMILAAATLWIHLPTAVFLCLPLGLALLVEPGLGPLVRRHWRALLISILIVAPYLFLVAQIAAGAIGTALPDWVNEARKQGTYGHVSLYYRLSRWTLSCALALAGLLAVNALAFTAWRDAPAAPERAAAMRRIFLFVAFTTASFVFLVIGVDVLDLSFLYPLQPLRMTEFAAILLVVLLVAAAPTIWTAVSTRKIRAGAAAWIFAFLLAMPAAYLRYQEFTWFVLRPTPARDLAWAEISREADHLPQDARVLVPYGRTDFYRYARRVSPFNKLYWAFLVSDTAAFDEINRRMSDFVAPNFLKDFTEAARNDPSHVDAYSGDLKSAWKALDAEKIERLRARYGLTHMIAESGRNVPGRVVWKNDFYELVDLR